MSSSPDELDSLLHMPENTSFLQRLKGRVHGLAEFFESKRGHSLILVLVGIDLVCVLAEIAVSLFETCQCDNSDPEKGHGGGGGGGHHDIDIELAEKILSVLSSISIGILFVFLFEIILKLHAYGLRYFIPHKSHNHNHNHNQNHSYSQNQNHDHNQQNHGSNGGHDPTFSWIHTLDAVVVIVSLVLEIVLKGREREVASLLIVFRLWRIIRVMDAVALSVKIEQTEHHETLRAEEMQIAEQTIQELRASNQELSKRVSELEQLLHHHKISH
ncbi:hypothetical protein GQ42DRAFT_163676 [Ramicandelaber brevisporus]|nr:hypothetical protein GQ42DRAFT_163676 [Ramicandelaber brevisporus]